MSCEVFANGDEIACKAGGGKVIASFPDVCLSPPSPPAGPIPVPYPDTSFSKDMQKGSKTVMIKSKEVMLKDQSFYKTSPLGDEAATKGLGAGVVTHVITGKTYFVAWSMDVKFEGQNVDRHSDFTTSNHASPIPNAGIPNPNLDAVATGAAEDASGECECCKPPVHPIHVPPGTKAMDMDTWYTSDKNGNPLPASDQRVKDYNKLMADVQGAKTATPNCTCNGKVTPEKPCNVFRKPVTKTDKEAVEAEWGKVPAGSPPGTKSKALQYKGRHRMPTEKTIRAKKSLPATCGACPRNPLNNKLTCGCIKVVNENRKVNHLTPKSAGGCAFCPGNLQKNGDKSAGVRGGLCDVCRDLDKRFGDLQTNVERS